MGTEHRNDPQHASDSPTDEASLLSSPSLKAKRSNKDLLAAKRRCVSIACIACRRRKSKCDGNTPSCAACASVYGTECVYDPGSDHRRKGVYKKDIGSLKKQNSTLQVLIQSILNYPESDAMDLVKQIRTCDNLEDVAQTILSRENATGDEDDATADTSDPSDLSGGLALEKELSAKMGELRVEDGAVRFLGGTSNLLHYDPDPLSQGDGGSTLVADSPYTTDEDIIKSWTSVTASSEVIIHLLNMYFTWHYTYFTVLSKSLFFAEFFKGKPKSGQRLENCTALLVNAMLALGCHFTSWPAGRADPENSATAGDHFFKEAKRLILENDEFETPRLATVQALALMSVREAGCGREAKGWVYSGMSFRMACDLGLNVNSETSKLTDHEKDARRITFWGCFLFDKCWSNYLGRPPQLPLTNVTAPKFDVFPNEDADMWSPWTDAGADQTHAQPSRIRAVALQISLLCEISNDLMLAFYCPPVIGRTMSKQTEVKKLSDFHTRLEAWRKHLPKEMDPKEGQLPTVLLMHMFFQLLYIHLFRPFLKYTESNSPLPPHVSPRKISTQAAGTISKLLRLYKRTYGLRQICNIAVYIAHSASTIHLLNLPDPGARRDIVHNMRHLEEIAESWPCASKTLVALGTQVRKWDIRLPEEAATLLTRAELKYAGQDNSSAARVSPTIVQVQRLAGGPMPNPGPVQSASEAVMNTVPPPPSSLPQRTSTTATSSSMPSQEISLAANAANLVVSPAGALTSQQQLPLQQGSGSGNGHLVGSTSTEIAPQVPHATTARTSAVGALQAAPSNVFAAVNSGMASTVDGSGLALRRNVHGTLFPSLETLFEGSKTWPFEDQNDFHEHWARGKPVPPGAIGDNGGVLLEGGGVGCVDNGLGPIRILTSEDNGSPNSMTGTTATSMDDMDDDLNEIANYMGYETGGNNGFSTMYNDGAGSVRVDNIGGVTALYQG